MKRIFLALGSNLGDREANLRDAIRNLNASAVQVQKLSPIYETEPEGVREQGWFLNAVADAQTDLLPEQLLTCVKDIETGMKRIRTAVNGPRIIDIDIVFYDSEVMQSPSLTIPHPRLRERRFVLTPMVDLAPDWVDPVTNKTMAELLTIVAPSRLQRLV